MRCGSGVRLGDAPGSVPQPCGWIGRMARGNTGVPSGHARSGASVQNVRMPARLGCGRASGGGDPRNLTHKPTRAARSSKGASIASRIFEPLPPGTRSVVTSFWPVSTSLAFFSGSEPSARQTLEDYWRGHWGIENRSHHCRDTVLHEDRCQSLPIAKGRSGARCSQWCGPSPADLTNPSRHRTCSPAPPQPLAALRLLMPQPG